VQPQAGLERLGRRGRIRTEGSRPVSRIRGPCGPGATRGTANARCPTPKHPPSGPSSFFCSAACPARQPTVRQFLPNSPEASPVTRDQSSPERGPNRKKLIDRRTSVPGVWRPRRPSWTPESLLAEVVVEQPHWHEPLLQRRVRRPAVYWAMPCAYASIVRGSRTQSVHPQSVGRPLVSAQVRPWAARPAWSSPSLRGVGRGIGAADSAPIALSTPCTAGCTWLAGSRTGGSPASPTATQPCCTTTATTPAASTAGRPPGRSWAR
jgi:hypothetical protein